MSWKSTVGASAASRGQGASAAVPMFERVIAMEPDFTPAYAGLVEAYSVWCWTNEGPTQDRCLEQMRPAAERTLALDPFLPTARGAMGIVAAIELRWKDAERHFEEALALPGDQTDIRVVYSSSTLWPQGLADKALDVLEVARASDPLSVNVKREFGMALYLAGRYDEAVQTLQGQAGPDAVVKLQPVFDASALPARSLTRGSLPPPRTVTV